MGSVLIGKLSATGENLHGVLSLPGISSQAKTVVPSDEAQEVVPDTGYSALSKVIVAPVPSNYGKITWNGVFILIT